MGRRGLSLFTGVAVLTALSCTQPKPQSRSGSARQPMAMSVTAYCVSGITKSGQQTRPGLVAADPRVLPLGSVIRVEGLPGSLDGMYTVADTGAAVKGRTIDIYMKDCSAARRFGRQRARVSIQDGRDS